MSLQLDNYGEYLGVKEHNFVVYRDGIPSREVPFHLGSTGQDHEHEPPGCTCRVDGVSAQVNDVQGHTSLFPLLDCTQAINGVAESPVELE